VRNRNGGGKKEKDDAVAFVITETLDGLKNPGDVQALTGKPRKQAPALERGARGTKRSPDLKPLISTSR
jgi:hypothetical protein